MTQITAGIACSFKGLKTVTATVTLGFEAGQPAQGGMVTIASDRWFQMYPR